ncbi:MAG: ABC transporter substrate-binding protein [Aromatoleum sp.]|jgi:NitT/TauT family transport system substrate-binding protein|uniref:ABC transporter substrate-binding protein n=1 Tax=Aromatoleum sp. TaxID=2307007 RepID=UPI0028946E27|nr:ABC transporter substrate-binding protein [Aromatoleum sp.]MDT3670354.1 ABC transporter substrate-binding protein [Aromatoleum sp.]
MSLKSFSRFIAALALLSAGSVVHAEKAELRLAQQYGISYLPLMVVEHKRLIEKHAAAEGLGDIRVCWSKFAGGNVMNDALLSGSLDFAAAGVAPATTLWAKTRGTPSEVRLVSATGSMPMLLNTRNPDVHSIKDFTEKDRIALPAVKVSIQAVTLQMAAEKLYGEGNHNKLDANTVTLAHPDAQAALLSGRGEISAHFTTPPFQYQQLENRDIRTVLNSYDVLGGSTTLNVVYTTAKFRDENPKTYKAFLAALEEAIAFINSDKKAAAEFYLRYSKDKDTVEDILAILDDPQVEFTRTPKNITRYADFMFRIGSIKQKPTSWKDLFFADIHHLAGS